jgi:hypothetical protein
MKLLFAENLYAEHSMLIQNFKVDDIIIIEGLWAFLSV